tara:strand:- start:222 stop:2129 length:1908 start_codon:yes stop_codon:yes gene_type:complete
MATVDELIVQIKADTRDLNKKLDEVSRKAGRASNSKGFRGLGTAIAAVKGPAMALAAAIVGIGVATGGIVRVGAAFEDLKLSLNAVTGSAEAGNVMFDRIREFAKTSPFQVRDLSKAFIQLKAAGIEPTTEMLTTFSDAASVTTDSLGAFQALVRITQRSVGGGLGLEELEQLSDRGIPVYEILAERLGVARKEISELGQTAEGAAQIMKELNIGLKESFGGTTAEKMDTVNQKFSTLSDSMDDLALAFFEEGGVGSGTKILLDTFTKLVEKAALFTRLMTTGRTKEFFEADTLEERAAALENQIKERKKNGPQGLDLARDLIHGDFKEQTKLLEIELSTMRSLILLGKHKERQDKDALEIKKQNKIERQKEREDARAEDDRISNLKQLVDSTVAPATILKDRIAELQTIAEGDDKDLITKVFGDKDTQVVLDNLKTKLEDMKPAIEETAGLLDDNMVQAIVNASNAFTNDFVNALLEGKSVLDSFANFAKNIVAQIISTFLQLAIVNKILNTVFGLGGTDMALPTGSFGSGGFNVQSNKASGGRIGGPALVGERGPEIFIPNSGGRVMNNHSSRLAMGGDGIVINQNLNFSTGVVPTVRQEIMKMLPTISDVTKASVLEAASRGGTYRRGLLGG